MVRKGQEAEDAFKRFEAQLKTFKLSLSPVVSELTKYLGVVTDIVNIGKELVFPTMPKGPAYELTGQEKKLFSLFGFHIMQRKELKRTPELWEIFGGESILGKTEKGAPPELPKEYPTFKMGEDMWKYFKESGEFIKIIQGDVVELIPVIKDYEALWEKIGRQPTLIYYEDIERQLAAFGTTLGEDKIQITEWSDSLSKNVTVVQKAAGYYKSLKDRMDELLNTAELLSTVRMQPGGPWTGAEFTYPTEDILTDWMVHPKTGLPVLVNQWKDQMNAMKNIFTEFSQNISSVWAENVKGLVSGAESFGDFFKKMSTSMVDVFISAVAKMIANWALFGSVRGAVSGTATGAGILGWLAKAVGISMWQAGGIVPGWKPIEAFQGGGMISRPTLGLIGEGGPEAVIPLKGGKIPIEGGGQTTINYIDIKAVDAPSFVALCKANPAGIIHAVGKSVNRNGPMRTVFK